MSVTSPPPPRTSKPRWPRSIVASMFMKLDRATGVIPLGIGMGLLVILMNFIDNVWMAAPFLILLGAIGLGSTAAVQAAAPAPVQPAFKLGTFENQGKTFVGVVLRDSVGIARPKPVQNALQQAAGLSHHDPLLLDEGREDVLEG